ncbi:MAG: hypothetical protein R3E69_13250 [Steroidobacteraceae bacterium]
MRESRTWIGWVVAAGLVAGCSSLPRLSWPWSKPPPAAPASVDELTFAAGSGVAIPQYWSGNTLVLDLSAAPASGAAVATPTYARGWPMRMAVRTWPGRFSVLEVRGAQRAVLPLTREGSAPVEIPIPPEVYAPGTREVSLSWGIAAPPPVVFPQAPDTPATPQSSMP